jgi:alcohol dehydrogenase
VALARISTSARTERARCPNGSKELAIMKAWMLDPKTYRLELIQRAIPKPRRGGVTVRVQAAMVLSYMKELLAGARGHTFPSRPFVPGTNGIGVIDAIGEGVYHASPGQRVSMHPHLVADERFADPAQLLMGHPARFGESAQSLQMDWVDGTFAEYVEWPASLITPIDSLGEMSAVQALGLSKAVVPYGGLLRVGVQAGEVVAINGASGFYGSAGVLVALAMGASRVLVVGRDAKVLGEVAHAGGDRAIPVVLRGDASDTATLRKTAGGAVDAALDMIGASSSASTATVLRSLRRGGRLAIMGSCPEPLSISFGEMLANDWLIVGQFMYPKDAPGRLVRLAASGQLNLHAIKPRAYALADLPQAMEGARAMRGLALTALQM